MKRKRHQVGSYYAYHQQYSYYFIVIFIALDDEHLSQITSNIMQIKERGASVIVITNLANIRNTLDVSRLDFLIELQPHQSLLAALQALIPLQMICYYTARAKGLNPDQQVFDAIDFDTEFH